MNPFQLTCPHCGYSKTIDRDKIPAHARTVRCPSCEKTFQLDLVTKTAQATTLTDTPSAETQPQLLPFAFTGNTREYFGIWIVNTLLKIVTLGIYSPWAKVRKRQYFYGNTLLDDANFDYLANPIALLKGWLLGAALFIVYTACTQFNPALGSLFGLLLFLLMPWIIVRSRLFNNRNSAHRNVRFNFRPAYAESYKVYAGLPILAGFTAGLLFPYAYYRQKRFIVENNRFGTSYFSFDAGLKDFYLLGLKAFGIVLLIFGGFMAFSTLLGTMGPSANSALPMAVGISMPLLILSGYFFLFIYLYVRSANLTWNGTFIGKNRFVSTMRVRDMTWIMFSNAIASILSVGLLIPWATIRLARYRLDNLALQAGGDLDRFRSARLEETSAAGEEIGDIFGIDIGI